MKKTITYLLVFSIMITGLALSAGIQRVTAEDTIVLGEPDWPGIEAKNAVVRFVLENIGYEVETTFARDAMLLESLTRGDIDIYMGAWLPQVLERRREYVGEVDYVTQNMTDGYYAMAVPDYVYEKGVTSLADIEEHADKFGRKVEDGVKIDLDLTHEQLASIVGTNRETITRYINRLQEVAGIRCEDHKIVLLDRSKLKMWL